MEVISIINHKGGVGKTTACNTIGSMLASRGYRVLLIDGDPSGNLTAFFREAINLPKLTPTLYDGFTGDAAPDELVHTFTFQRWPGDRFVVKMDCVSEPQHVDRYFTPVTVEDTTGERKAYVDNMDIEPSEFENLQCSRDCTLSLIPCGSEFSMLLNDVITSSEKDLNFISRLLEPLQNDYDFVLIDCPPEAIRITVPIIRASTCALIPTEAKADSINGIASLLTSIRQLNSDVVILGTYFSKVKLNESVPQKQMDDLRLALQGEGLIFNTIIKENSMPDKVRAATIPLAVYRPASDTAKQYSALTDEILERCGFAESREVE